MRLLCTAALSLSSVLLVVLGLGLREQNNRLRDLQQQLDRLEQLVNIHDREMANQQMGLLQSQVRQLQQQFNATDQIVDQIVQGLNDAAMAGMSKASEPPPDSAQTETERPAAGQPETELQGPELQGPTP